MLLWEKSDCIEVKNLNFSLEIQSEHNNFSNFPAVTSVSLTWTVWDVVLGTCGLNTWHVIGWDHLSIIMYYQLTSANQINEPCDIEGGCYQRSQSVNQTLAEAHRERSENMFSVEKNLQCRFLLFFKNEEILFSSDRTDATAASTLIWLGAAIIVFASVAGRHT